MIAASKTSGMTGGETFPWVSLTWVAARAGCSASTISRRIAADGGLQVHKFNARCSVVRRDEAIAWVEAQAT